MRREVDQNRSRPRSGCRAGQSQCYQQYRRPEQGLESPCVVAWARGTLRGARPLVITNQRKAELPRSYRARAECHGMRAGTLSRYVSGCTGGISLFVVFGRTYIRPPDTTTSPPVGQLEGWRWDFVLWQRLGGPRNPRIGRRVP